MEFYIVIHFFDFECKAPEQPTTTNNEVSNV